MKKKIMKNNHYSFFYGTMIIGGIIMKIFKCNKCGNIVELIEGDNSNIMCCGEKMEELVPNTVDAANEKHIPSCEINDDIVVVKIGEVLHPMEEKHYIEWVVAEYSDSIVKYKFQPGESPEAEFDYEKGMKIYAYCNLHGLWMKEL